MPFFQNPFDSEFRGSWILGDRQYSMNFNVKGNINSNSLCVAWKSEPYDFSTYTDLTINYAIDPEHKTYVSMTIDVSGATAAATTALEVASKLNSDPEFSGWFEAFAQEQNPKLRTNVRTVLIRPRKAKTNFRYYISNSEAESILQFNLKAPIAEFPTYMRRHTIEERYNYIDSLSQLIELDTGDSYHAYLIDSQKLDSSVEQEDWQLLAGRSGIFPFKKLTYDGSSRISSIIEYSAGAAPGDLAMITKYHYDGAATSPDIITTEPMTLTSGDLVTPPF